MGDVDTGSSSSCCCVYLGSCRAHASISPYYVVQRPNHQAYIRCRVSGDDWSFVDGSECANDYSCLGNVQLVNVSLYVDCVSYLI